MKRRSWLVYGALFAAWAAILSWQAIEHARVKESARASLVNHAKDISTTMGLVLRTERPGRLIYRDRVESALRELLKPGEIFSLAVLSASGEIVAAVGNPIQHLENKSFRTEWQWEEKTVLLMNLIDLGTNVAPNVLPRNEWFGTNRFSSTNFAPRGWRNWRREWDSEESKKLAEKKGAHSCVLVMSTAPVHQIVIRDLWLRSMVLALAALAVAGGVLAWRSFATTSDLQLRLVRTSELNTHLKELNLAAAGLAHETRNPLNIIRGLAQMISKEDGVSLETKKKSREIIDEADRVAGQLNEFINYSRPREVRVAPVTLSSLVQEVAKALIYDLEEKGIQLSLEAQPVVIQADEQLLRQAFFNLLLNATQAVDKHGRITIRASQNGPSEALLEILDDGPGVASEHHSEIFKPYFTTHQKGTGLGLAVVQQIVLAHGWDIECVPNEPKGAIFRITHLRLADKK